MKKKKLTFRYLSKNILVIFFFFLVWRGVWHILDQIDLFLFGGNHIWSAVIGMIVGLATLYIPDKNLKEIEKL
jgi:hypothetical protein